MNYYIYSGDKKKIPITFPTVILAEEISSADKQYQAVGGSPSGCICSNFKLILVDERKKETKKVYALDKKMEIIPYIFEMITTGVITHQVNILKESDLDFFVENNQIYFDKIEIWAGKHLFFAVADIKQLKEMINIYI